jgi:hypothetical protein
MYLKALRNFVQPVSLPEVKHELYKKRRRSQQMLDEFVPYGLICGLCKDVKAAANDA